MAVSHGRDLEAAAASLSRWLTERVGEPVDVVDVTSPATTGYSHETLLFTARWGGEERPLVARLEPTGHTVFPDPDFAAEYRILEALAPTDVPVPMPHGFEPDASVLGSAFSVVSRVDGRAVDDNPPYTFGGWLHDAAPAEQEQVWWAGVDALARVHRVDPTPMGLPVLEPVSWLERYLAWVIPGEPPPTIAAGLAWLRSHAPSEPGATGLVWGDARPGNQMFRDGECVAVLDWELACIGDQDLDVGWWLYFDRLFAEGLDGARRPPGFPSREDTIARYESLAARTVRNLAWYEVYASFLFAVVLVRVTQLLAGTGTIDLTPENERDNFAIAFLGRMLEEAGAPA